MSNKRKSLGQRPLWIIARQQASGLDVLTIDPDDDGGFLPVFSFEEEAETFMRLSDDDWKKMGWWSREMVAGELVSILVAPCAEAKRVALDPLPLPLGRAALPLISVARECFLQDLIGESRGATGELAPV